MDKNQTWNIVLQELLKLKGIRDTTQSTKAILNLAILIATSIVNTGIVNMEEVKKYENEHIHEVTRKGDFYAANIWIKDIARDHNLTL